MNDIQYMDCVNEAKRSLAKIAEEITIDELRMLKTVILPNYDLVRLARVVMGLQMVILKNGQSLEPSRLPILYVKPKIIQKPQCR